jgi:hypothetical protein
MLLINLELLVSGFAQIIARGAQQLKELAKFIW